MRNIVKIVVLFLLLSISQGVFADVKCDDGKPGATVNCVVTNANVNGSVSRIKVDEGLEFVSCDVCDDTTYALTPENKANFKFKIAEEIAESKTLRATFGGETAQIKVVIESESEEEENDEATTYTITLVPGKGQANKTKSCSVNSLNDTCNVTLDKIENPDFTGWGKEKDCTQGDVEGSIKVNKNITYYACYKSAETEEDAQDEEEQDNINSELVLKSLVVKNGDDEIDLGFSIRIFEYEIEVPLDVESLEVDAVAEHKDVKINISGNDKLENATNKIVVELVLNDEKKEYVINVLKKDEKKLPLLNNLVIAGYLNDFQPERFNYTVKLDKGIKSLTIDYDVNKTYEVVVVGNENLKNGSQIKILVSDPKADLNSSYVINVEQYNSSLYIWLAVGVGLLVVLIILLVIVVNKGKKQNKSNNKNNNKKVESKKNAKKVGANVSIPEVSPITPQTPITQQSNDNSQKKSLETLDI